MAECEHSVDKIPVGCDEFCVDLLNEIRPVEIRVMIFGHVDT